MVFYGEVSMKVAVTIKNGNKKLEALKSAEKHIKAARELFSWALSGPIELEMQEPPKDGSND